MKSWLFSFLLLQNGRVEKRRKPFSCNKFTYALFYVLLKFTIYPKASQISSFTLFQLYEGGNEDQCRRNFTGTYFNLSFFFVYFLSVYVVAALIFYLVLVWEQIHFDHICTMLSNFILIICCYYNTMRFTFSIGGKLKTNVSCKS